MEKSINHRFLESISCFSVTHESEVIPTSSKLYIEAMKVNTNYTKSRALNVFVFDVMTYHKPVAT